MAVTSTCATVAAKILQMRAAWQLHRTHQIMLRLTLTCTERFLNMGRNAWRAAKPGSMIMPGQSLIPCIITSHVRNDN